MSSRPPRRSRCLSTTSRTTGTRRGGWGNSFIIVEADGRQGRDLRIHRGIRIVNNRVKGLPKGVPFVNAPCALDPVIKDNECR